jgi:hypothetical protein
MTFYKNEFLDAAGLEKVARGHAENEFLLKSLTARQAANPMPLLYLDRSARYIVRLRDDGMIVAAATLYEDLVGKDVTMVGQISARVGHKRHGHGFSLATDVFNQAAKDRKTLYMTPFEAEGAAASAAVVQIHAAHPSVPVHYNGQPAPVTGHRRYRLESTPFGVVPQIC